MKKNDFFNQMLPQIVTTEEVEVLTSDLARSIKGGIGGTSSGCTGGSAFACGCYQATQKLGLD
ncbi:MAG: hypothetical protein LBP85_10345 [Prevotellaceae bacterium]|jgi:hypothetical protein|nr:hypothetical protein [Prevotellaceae bacterium]